MEHPMKDEAEASTSHDASTSSSVVNNDSLEGRRCERVETLEKAKDVITTSNQVLSVVMLPSTAGESGSDDTDPEYLPDGPKDEFYPAGELEVEEELDLEHVVQKTKGSFASVEKVRRSGYDLSECNNRAFTVSPQEIRQFIGVILLSGYNCQPEAKHYWSTQPDIGAQGAISCMSHNRFMKIKKYLHWADNQKLVKGDKMSKPCQAWYLRAPYRLFSRIITKRLTAAVTLNGRQKAFLHGVNGVFENASTFHACIKDAKAGSKEIYVAMLDLAKAFDSVPHEVLMRALQRKNVHQASIDLIVNMLTGTTYPEFKELRGRPVRICNGVRQGDPLSPRLFHLFIDELIERLQASGPAYDFWGSKICVLAFADDLTLLADSAAGLKILLKVTNDFLANSGMKLNAAKCRTLSVCRSPKTKKMFPNPAIKFSILDNSTDDTLLLVEAVYFRVCVHLLVWCFQKVATCGQASTAAH
ncbi:Retrovirus-related Pol polyprotein from type-1 retrotransposable element [Trichinella nelsoni]|uniref:Retrovirus-related Pol polyprotein from type-1 retrotransposable element n=1 Tax=Trichinella nelsoni TaxID=6336 RepID=A0A0V0S664_9BILA|nr:Retrovirus-related Pol polyprotein from type-1 retrotransposable element [Trichinella nelsoni]